MTDYWNERGGQEVDDSVPLNELRTPMLDDNREKGDCFGFYPTFDDDWIEEGYDEECDEEDWDEWYEDWKDDWDDDREDEDDWYDEISGECDYIDENIQ